MQAFLSDTQAACLPVAALTAWRALVVEGQVKAGDVVLLEGTGGVSIFGLQFAKACGAEVIITSSSDEKLERARAMGADHTINYVKHPEWSEEVRRLVSRGVDQVVEVGGAGTLKQAMKSIRFGGQIAVIGVLSGAKHELNIGATIGSGVRMKGIFVGSRADFEEMCRAIDLHRIEPVIDRVFPLAEADAALAYLEAGKHFGKVCLSV